MHSKYHDLLKYTWCQKKMCFPVSGINQMEHEKHNNRSTFSVKMYITFTAFNISKMCTVSVLISTCMVKMPDAKNVIKVIIK